MPENARHSLEDVPEEGALHRQPIVLLQVEQQHHDERGLLLGDAGLLHEQVVDQQQFGLNVRPQFLQYTNTREDFHLRNSIKPCTL